MSVGLSEKDKRGRKGLSEFFGQGKVKVPSLCFILFFLPQNNEMMLFMLS